MQDNSTGGDRKLDDFLAGYAAVEPQPGLEQRVLANLRASRQPGGARIAWRGPALALLAAAIAVAAASSSWLVKRRTVAPLAVSVPVLPLSAGDNLQQPVPARTEGERRLPRGTQTTWQTRAETERRPRTTRLTSQTGTDVAPKLDRFPAPEPLSEQEKMLVRFVQHDPHEAELVAQERAEESQREAEEMKKFGEGAEGAQQ
jgi:hypothetical protein